jgi:hypothetical protein
MQIRTIAALTMGWMAIGALPACEGRVVNSSVAAASAALCKLISVEKELAQQLDAELRSFFDARGLALTKTPSLSSYRSADYRVAVDVIRLGPFGTSVAVFYRDGSRDLELESALVKFLETEISRRYVVRSCEEVPGFQVPKHYFTPRE